MDHKPYFNDARTWDEEIIANAIVSRNRAWIFALFSMLISALAMLALLFLLPLKTFEPYVITVDKHTGYYEISKPLEDMKLSSEKAITESNLVRYVSLREQYNPAILKQNYEQVVLMSKDTALKEFQSLWEAKNPNNPSIKFGKLTNIDVKIKSVSFISDRIASIRFLKEQQTPEGSKISHWNAVIEFQYSAKPMKMLERFENPLGFQVINYRINPEAMEAVK